MGVLGRVREVFTGDTAGVGDAEVAGLRHAVEVYESRIMQLEQALLEPGWLRMAATAELEFTREGLGNIARLCRLMAIKNPLLRRASALKTYYVFGQGVEISAEDPDVAEVVTEFVDDPKNQQVLFGHDARGTKEKALHTDANVFVACFTHPRTGRVQLRSIPFDQVHDIIYDPQDAEQVWFYERHWTQTVRDPVSGAVSSQLRKALYPDIDHRPPPRERQGMWGGMPVRWDSPVLHVHSNRPEGWRFGVPELYPALDWARAHAEYLDDFRRLVKVLAKLAWKLQGVKGSQLDRAKAKMAQATAEDAPVGQAFVADVGGGQLEPAIRTGGGMKVEPGDARQFALMVSAATDIPETMLLGDPSTGNLATATTLDRPTELAFEDRRKMWVGVYTRLCQYVMDASVKAPAGKLRGVIERDEWSREVVTLRGDASRSINVDWAPIVERSMGDVIKALVGSANGANAIEGMPWQVILRTALVALDVDDPDEMIAEAERVMEREAAAAPPGDDDGGSLAEVLGELREAIASLPDAA